MVADMKFSKCLNQKIDLPRVRLEALRPWVQRRVSEIMQGDDDVLVEFVFNQLEEKTVDPRRMQVSLTGFLSGEQAQLLMAELWQLLADASASATGVPEQQLQQRLDEITQRQAVQQQAADEQPEPQQQQQPQPADQLEQQAVNYRQWRLQLARDKIPARKQQPAAPAADLEADAASAQLATPVADAGSDRRQQAAPTEHGPPTDGRQSAASWSSSSLSPLATPERLDSLDSPDTPPHADAGRIPSADGAASCNPQRTTPSPADGTGKDFVDPTATSLPAQTDPETSRIATPSLSPVSDRSLPEERRPLQPQTQQRPPHMPYLDYAGFWVYPEGHQAWAASYARYRQGESHRAQSPDSRHRRRSRSPDSKRRKHSLGSENRSRHRRRHSSSSPEPKRSKDQKKRQSADVKKRKKDRVSSPEQRDSYKKRNDSTSVDEESGSNVDAAPQEAKRRRGEERRRHGDDGSASPPPVEQPGGDRSHSGSDSRSHTPPVRAKHAKHKHKRSKGKKDKAGDERREPEADAVADKVGIGGDKVSTVERRSKEDRRAEKVRARSKEEIEKSMKSLEKKMRKRAMKSLKLQKKLEKKRTAYDK